MLLSQSPPNETEAEAEFQAAIATAQKQQAKSWELRATVSLCRLWKSQNRHPQAHQQLASLLDWFSEDANTPDLISARELLEELLH